jgi:hypothetical protein
VSFTVITCVREEVLPQASFATQVRVRVNLLAHCTFDFTSVRVIVGVPSQLSFAVCGGAGGISLAVETVSLNGKGPLNSGACWSFT